MENSLNKIKSPGFLENVLNAFDEPFYVICVADYSIVLANNAARVLGIETAHTCHMLTHRKSTPCKGEEHSCPMDLVIHSRQPYVI